jgi:hypothetical protein
LSVFEQPVGPDLSVRPPAHMPIKPDAVRLVGSCDHTANTEVCGYLQRLQQAVGGFEALQVIV